MKKIGPYLLEKEIGVGHFSKVYLGKKSDNKQLVALKMINKQGMKPQQLKNIFNEIQVLEKSSHKNLVRLHDKYMTSNNYYLILEYCNGRDLAHYLKLVKRVSERVARAIIIQIIEGMYYLNTELRAIHRDLKLQNIFLHFPSMESQEELITDSWLLEQNLEQLEFIVKIGDFGFSKIMQNLDDLSITYCGTPINMSPEMLNHQSYNYKTDVWSLGTIFYELVTGESPFSQAKNKEQLKSKLIDNFVILPYQLNLSKDCLKFTNYCLTYSMDDRPSWKELKDHNFIRLPIQPALFTIESFQNVIHNTENIIIVQEAEEIKEQQKQQCRLNQEEGSKGKQEELDLVEQDEDEWLNTDELKQNEELHLIQVHSSFKNPNSSESLKSKNQINQNYQSSQQTQYIIPINPLKKVLEHNESDLNFSDDQENYPTLRSAISKCSVLVNQGFSAQLQSDYDVNTREQQYNSTRQSKSISNNKVFQNYSKFLIQGFSSEGRQILTSSQPKSQAKQISPQIKQLSWNKLNFQEVKSDVQLKYDHSASNKCAAVKLNSQSTIALISPFNSIGTSSNLDQLNSPTAHDIIHKQQTKSEKQRKDGQEKRSLASQFQFSKFYYQSKQNVINNPNELEDYDSEEEKKQLKTRKSSYS